MSQSKVWKYFIVKADKPDKVEFLQSKSEISRGGKVPGKFTTTIMRNHLKNKHPNKWNELETTEREEKELRKSDTSVAMSLKKSILENLSLIKR